MLPSRIRAAIFRLSNSLPVHEHHQKFVPKKYNKAEGKVASEAGRKGRVAAKMWSPIRLSGMPVFNGPISRRARKALRHGGKS